MVTDPGGKALPMGVAAIFLQEGRYRQSFQRANGSWIVQAGMRIRSEAGTTCIRRPTGHADICIPAGIFLTENTTIALPIRGGCM